MKLTYTPLLQTQRDLYDIPRGIERFNTYIATMTDAQTGDLKLPLSAMNPMGKEHVPALLEDYLALQADEIVAEDVAKAVNHLAHIDGEYRATLVIADDTHGMWTEHYSVAFGERFSLKPHLRRGWLVGLLWTSNQPSLQLAREAALTAVYRGAYVLQHRYPETLAHMIAQEGYALKMAGVAQALDEEEIAYTHEVLAPLMSSDEHPVIMSAIFGDEAAKLLGYEPLGVSHHAGLMLGLAEAESTLP